MTDIKTNGADADAKDTARHVADKARAAASDAAEAAKSQARVQADSAKASLAGEVDSVASALRGASEDLADNSPQERAAARAADTLGGVADSIRDADLGGAVSGVTRFARRNPAAFLGTAALLGFAAARFAKATAEEEADTHATDRGEAAPHTPVATSQRAVPGGTAR